MYILYVSFIFFIFFMKVFMIHSFRASWLILPLFVLCMTGCAKKNIKISSLEQIKSTQEKITDTSGKDRVLEIITTIEHNVVPAQSQPVQYAHVQNIQQDLSLENIAAYFDCKTVMGKSFLTQTLNHPVCAVDESGIVAHRKKAIEQLVENPELKKQVDEILQLAAQQEQLIIQLMSDFFIGKTCPELQNLALLKNQNPYVYPFAEFCTTNKSMQTAKTVLQMLSLFGCTAGTIGFGITAANAAHMGAEYGQLACLSGYFGILTGLYGYIIYDDFTKAGEKRSKIHALNQLIHVAEKIEQLCDAYQIDNQFKMSLIQDAQGARLVKELKHCRYTQKKNYCFNTPAVHTLLYKVYKNDKHLAQMFASIAEMDAYNAIATKMLASQQSHNKFCFAESIESEKPLVSSTGFWNVLIPHAVPNTLLQYRNIILTGPNAGGKTSLIKAILQNIVLAQTYGVAAAEKFEFTQFDVILSYLTISDDLIQGQSLFQSEINRAQELLQTIKSLQPHQKLFFALDELFTGTASQGGERTAYKFIDKVASFDRVLSIYATHFDALKDLGAAHASLMNYKVNAPVKNEKNKFVYPYTVSAGHNDICIAVDMAEQAGLFD